MDEQGEQERWVVEKVIRWGWEKMRWGEERQEGRERWGESRRAGWAVGSDGQASLDSNTGGYWYKKGELIILVIRYAGLVLCSLDGHFGMDSELSFVSDSNTMLSCPAIVRYSQTI